MHAWPCSKTQQYAESNLALALEWGERCSSFTCEARTTQETKLASALMNGQVLPCPSKQCNANGPLAGAAASCGHTPLEAVASVDRAAAARRLGVYLERTPQAESLRGVLPKCQSHVILRPLRSLQGMQTATMATSEASAWAKMPKRTRDSPPR